MVQTPTHETLPSILPLYTMFGSVCFSTFYFHCAISLNFHVVLTPYLPRIKVRKEKNLLNKGTDEDAEQEVEEVRRTEISFLTVYSTIF